MSAAGSRLSAWADVLARYTVTIAVTLPTPTLVKLEIGRFTRRHCAARLAAITAKRGGRRRDRWRGRLCGRLLLFLRWLLGWWLLNLCRLLRCWLYLGRLGGRLLLSLCRGTCWSGLRACRRKQRTMDKHLAPVVQNVHQVVLPETASPSSVPVTDTAVPA